VRWRQAIHELAAISRPSASEGERLAAERIATWLKAAGCHVRIDRELAHGGYWWPIGLGNVAAAAGAGLALRRPTAGARGIATALAGASAVALWDDLGHGRRWFRRALLPQRPTWNVVAEIGDLRAPRTVVLVAHHDAAHSGLVFHPALGRIGPRIAPRAHARSSHTLPILYAVWLGPVAVAVAGLLGSRRLLRTGAALSMAACAAMADIGMRGVVPGANDNLSAVGVLLAIADAVAQDPVAGVRVLLVSTGSEESFSEGMQAFGERYFADLPRETTEFLCLECLGGRTLIVLEGEGMLRMRDYPEPMREALAEAGGGAADAPRAPGAPITRGLRTVAATDGIIALRAGYPVVTLASVEDTKLPLNYHWPTDTPENLRWPTVENAIATCEAFIRRRGADDAFRSGNLSSA
jgi:hypothetical protein